jgi:hypothetical protein
VAEAAGAMAAVVGSLCKYGKRRDQVEESVGMSRNTGRTVYLRSDGLWANKSNDALRASGMHPHQAEAADEARRMLAAVGGGDLTIKNEVGVVLSRESVAADGAEAIPSKAT